MALSRGSRICPEPNLLNSYSLSWNSPIYDPVRCLGLKPDSILATAFMKLKSRPKASEARLISSTGVPTGVSLNELKTIRRLLSSRQFGPDVIGEIPEILRHRRRVGGFVGRIARRRHRLGGIMVRVEITIAQAHRFCFDRNRCQFRPWPSTTVRKPAWAP